MDYAFVEWIIHLAAGVIPAYSDPCTQRTEAQTSG